MRGELDGAPELCGQGPVSRASTLRSAVPETLPDGTHHCNRYLRLMGRSSLHHRPVAPLPQGPRG